MSDLQEIIANSTVRAFNAGYEAGIQEVLAAVKSVQVEYDYLTVAIVSDLEEELKYRASFYQSKSPASATAQPKVPVND